MYVYSESERRQGASVSGEKMEKKIITVGRLNSHQWGQIVDRGGYCQQKAQDNRSEDNRSYQFVDGKALNAYPNGTCRTLKAQYVKNGLNNFFRTDSFGATGVIRKRKKKQIREKKTIVMCDLGVGGERGRVMNRKCCATAITATEYKDPQKVLKKIHERDRHKTGNQR